MTRWVMVADLERCVGCQTCTAACKHVNATSPAVQWRKVLDIEAGTYPNVSRTFVPVGCQHCDDPPCMHVCPTTATRRRADGIVTIDYDLCIGCAYCDVACPYQARFKVDAPSVAYGRAIMQHEFEREEPARIGVAQKCTFCSDRIDFGLANGLTPGIDPRATPACVNACIADALHFGDARDPSSNVSRLLREQKHFRMHAQLRTEPGFYYLYDKANGHDLTSGADGQHSATAGQIRAEGAEPWHQRHWDWKAAGNFMCGGAGAGLFATAAIASSFGGALLPSIPLAMALIAFGLFLVLLKIGRPMRSVYVLRQPQRSWMAREAWIAALFFPLAGLALWFDSRFLVIAAAIAAALFLFSQAMILREAKGIPAWREPTVVPLIVTTGLAEGCGLFVAVMAARQSFAHVGAVAIVVVILAASRAVLWSRYLDKLVRTGAPTRTLQVLNAAKSWPFILGLVWPTTLVFASLLIAQLGGALIALGGLCVFVAGWVLKFILVTKVAFNQGFALEHTPVHGAGVPGSLVKPGWSQRLEAEA
jgi:phenylacetyl-CoA:acceptor oxidoreductase subunit 1